MGYTVSAGKACIQRGLESRAGLPVLAISHKMPGRGVEAGGLQKPSDHRTACRPLFMSTQNCFHRADVRCVWEEGTGKNER